MRLVGEGVALTLGKVSVIDERDFAPTDIAINNLSAAQTVIFSCSNGWYGSVS